MLAKGTTLSGAGGLLSLRVRSVLYRKPQQGRHGGTRLALFKVKDGCIEDGTMSEAQNVAWCLCVEKGMWETELSCPVARVRPQIQPLHPVGQCGGLALAPSTSLGFPPLPGSEWNSMLGPRSPQYTAQDKG